MGKHGTKPQTYTFRYEDTGEVVEVDFATMMQQDTAGFLQIKGRVAKRINRPSVKASVKEPSAVDQPMVSDALGFTVHQLEDFETDRMANGFRSVEFKPDPLTPGFLQVHFHNRAERDRYIKHRGMADHNSRNGSRAMLSKSLLAKTSALIVREKVGRD